MLDEQSFVGGHYRSDDFNKPPSNRYNIIRAQLDKWISEKVEQRDALLICKPTVSDLLMDGQNVIGVKPDRMGGSVYADIVVLVDGVNSVLARKAGFRPELDPDEVALAVKEIHFMPQEVIESRFNVSGDAGVVIEMAGKITKG